MKKKVKKSDFNVSEINFAPEVRSRWFLPKRVYVTDETLREGEETPGAIMTTEHKLELAEILESMGVYETNVGYVSGIEDHADFSRKVKKRCKKLETSAYIRVYGEKGDFKDRVKYALDTGVDRIAVLIPISDYQFKIKKTTKWKAFEDAIVCTQKAKAAGAKKITFAPYDTSRTDLDYLKLLYKTAVAEGADRALAYDTIGVLSPDATFYWFRELKKAVNVPFQYHCHDDFGLAVANTCAAVTAGVEYIDIVINGLGDRAGNANFEETVMCLEGLYHVNTGIDTTRLFKLCKLVEKITKVPLPANKPMTGFNTFIHESDIHVAALLSGQAPAFEPYEPHVVGQERTIWFGSTTSLDSLETMAESMKVKLTDAQAKKIMQQIRKKVNERGYATDKEVRGFISKLKK